MTVIASPMACVHHSDIMAVGLYIEDLVFRDSRLEKVVNEGDMISAKPLLPTANHILHHVPQVLPVPFKLHRSFTAFFWNRSFFHTSLH